MVNRLVLWDIDGTLMRAGAVAGEIFSTAVEHVVGRHPGEHQVLMGGKTDPQIALEILAAMGIEAGPGHEHLPLVVGRLEAELAGAVDLIREKGVVLPGVRELLATLAADDDVAQSVLTGNTVVNAATKLAALELDQWLDLEIGAYGSDDPDRLSLVPVALARAADLRGRTFRPEEVWVIGDTRHDLACARAASARCLLVRTGHLALGDECAAADAILDDLADVDEVLRLIRS
ncbi:MAG: hypothetical protein AVDCRST_MAG50-1831 [uncultured Acidimicrobiales bacterium]|uniref:Uncharacterized protein n=1 Tax=uncultured Acidimicrobiales bacterium TaxID=310071 RepID=A0A6J4I4J9_9ACTN|nr:MAG: hypothetical protein AVDCRST_MAG50-1831 [uncultured Acidimicrobiales bacterium]